MKNILNNAVFIRSITQASQLSDGSGNELAIIGRSNAGKSSAINKICNNKKLAKTSKTPGRTQAINLFEVAPSKRLADLPGYGYANVSSNVRKQWDALLSQYFSTRDSLRCIFLIVDCRRGISSSDTDVINWIISVRENMPIHILLTKSDKLSYSQASQTLNKSTHLLKEQGYINTSVQLFSSVNSAGVSNAQLEIHKHLGL